MTQTIHVPTLPQELDPMARSPLEFDHGLFLSDAPGRGGVHGFCWFESDHAALEWLRHEAPSIHAGDDADGDAFGSEVRRLLAGTGRLEDIPIAALNLLSCGLFELRWAGSFMDLMFCDHPFARAVQADFHALVFPDERGQGPMGTMDEDFATHLLNYHTT